MNAETTEVLVVGGGQAGIAMSEHLRACGLPHLVLERGRVAERWRSGRWDSLVANGPAWHDRFPGLEYPRSAPHEFPGKDEVADYFEEYARMIDAPIRCGVEVESVEKLDGAPGFLARTSEGEIHAGSVVAATGPFEIPLVPPLVPEDAGVAQLHSADYRNPGQLADGGVLVVGAGSSGVQIAEELLRSGREVWLSVGPHDRPPRSYRGRDYVWWLGVLGKWDSETSASEHVTIAVSGAHGGRTVDFRRLAADGVKLVGMAREFRDGVLSFAPDLADNIRAGDANYLSVLDEADGHAAREGLDLPEEPEARIIPPDPGCMTDPALSLDLAGAGISTILWATGYAMDFGWLKVDAFDGRGRPVHSRGVSRVPGVYFLGLPLLSSRKSSFIYGVWHDAKHVADRIFSLRKYAEHHRDNPAGVGA